MQTTDPKVIARTLKHKNIAVVGLSKNPEKDSHEVAVYLQRAGYKIIPINPTADKILGERAYKDLEDAPLPLDVVNVFRPSSEVSGIVDKAIKIGAKAVWTQLGITDEEAGERAMKAGLDFVMNRCMMIEHKKLANRT